MLRFHTLTIARIEPAADNAAWITLEVPERLRDAYRFIQGQHINIQARIDGETLRRSYSIVNSVAEGGLSIGIRRVEGGRFSVHANETLRPGDTLEVMTPTGQFHTPLDPAARKTYLAFAAGAGITPILSMLKTTLAVEPRSSFVLFYGNRRRATTMFREQLMDLKNRYIDRFNIHFLFTREPTDMPLFNGRIDAGKARELIAAFRLAERVDECYVCGPDTMIDEVTAAAAAAGIAQEHIHLERFGIRRPRPEHAETPPAEAPAAGAHSVTVIIDTVRRAFTMDREATVLDAAHAQGLDLPYSCKAGVCSTCRTRLIEGEVEMDAHHALEPWELEAGYILACQSHPVTERIVLDYDQ
jgi:ring-1,2-phenylacetyl-CoA epoxidase subunit PaaE